MTRSFSTTADLTRLADNGSLLDVLGYSGSGMSEPVSPAVRRLAQPLDAAIVTAVQDRATRLGVDSACIYRAALALADSRLTGNAQVTLHGLTRNDNTVTLPIPETGKIDDWLTSITSLEGYPVTGAHGGRAADTSSESVIGVWADPSGDAHEAHGHTPVTWSIKTADAGPELRAACRESSLDAPAMQLLTHALINVLAGLGSCERIETVSVLDEAQYTRILVEWNNTAIERRTGETVHGCFSAMARQHPQRVAIAGSNAGITYAEAESRSNRIAGALREAGVDIGATVGLLLDRSPEAVIAILGIIKAGAVYLPLDPMYPDERLAFAIRDAHVRIVIGMRGAELPARSSAILMYPDDLEAGPEISANPSLGDDALAYVMYTSGSTGTPKGVEIAHRSIIRLVRSVDYVDFGEHPRVLHAAPLGFDASTFEIWGALLNGGTCVIHAERVPTGPALAVTIDRHDVRIAWLTGALFNAIVDENAGHLGGLGQLLIGGEALSVPHVRAAYAALPDIDIINGYGPTECTSFAATYRIPRNIAPGARSIPIGRPIADTTLYVLNARRQPVPAGVIGELYIGGAGLARGYLGRPDLTADRFVENPFGAESAHVYRTGDLVRWLPEGVIEFVGRADGQVKIRGYRIETGAIQTAIQHLQEVRNCAVILREDRPGHKRLIAYYVATDPKITAAFLREHLAGTLPEFMIPAVYMRLDALPVTINGKLDRRALPTPDRRRPELAYPFVAASGPLEQRLCDLFAELLDIEQVGRNDNFFDLGGTSLLAVQALARINAEISPKLKITALFDDPRPAALASGIDKSESPAAADNRPHRERDRADPIAIIAMAGRFPGADDVEGFWRNLCGGEESITFFSADELDPGVGVEQRDPDYVRARGVIDGVEQFDASFFGITPREAELMDPQQRIFLELCWECLERGGHVPDAHAAPVGIFAGMHNASYFQRHLAARPDLLEKFGEFQAMLGNEKDYIAARVAHKLNLTGPAISMNTACSTSLVAICQAVDALRAGQCTMALAGGASVTCPPRSGYLHQAGSMLSPDGHTRSFDADAQGTVFSDGAAVVLLKRLGDALADGDPVYALIRGAAVNNDGAVKASFTAPSSAGQTAVISMALDDAGVDARSISYVEAHGTATPIGDPIEIEGLTRAFRRTTDGRDFCAIGSLKSNVGHLVIAAGAAGVIKSALALSERELPPSLHFRSTNPKIDFADSPFYVNNRRKPWISGEGPRRAGVSSFGVGGTNAHVILEEAPPREPSDPAIGAQLLLLSARTPSALNVAITQLENHLADRPDTNLADVALTLAAGRKTFAQRSFIVAADAGHAVSQLQALASISRHKPGVVAVPGVVFLFPGQGAQYAGMGRALHASESAFRDALDECAACLRDELGFDLRDRLFDDDAEALRATALTQPATFAVEYALARLWMSLGVQPVAMIGHSVGEFVAAVIAGVMDLAEAARLVARRGRLMQAQPAGSMLSVRLAPDSLVGRMPAALSLAAVNAPNACVVSGETSAIEAFRDELESAGIAGRLLHTSHAFHSAMMDAVLEPFRAEVAQVSLRAPSIPIISTLTGAPLGDADAVSPDYWTRHLREPVRFAAALESVLDSTGQAFLEVGPRATLGTLTRQNQKTRESIVSASMSDTPDNERGAWLRAGGELWCAGVPIAIDALDRRQRKRRLRLPTYPFERERYWVEAQASAAPARAGGGTVTEMRPMARIKQAAPPARETVTEISMRPSTPEADSSPDRYRILLAQLVELVEEVAGVDLEGSDPAANFVEYGLDSLALTQVALQLQKTFSLKVTFRELMESYSTFERLAQHIDKLLPADVSTEKTLQPDAGVPMDLASDLPAAAGDGLLQDVIRKQMSIMQRQLALLEAAGSRTSKVSGIPPSQDNTKIANAQDKTAVDRSPQAEADSSDDEAAVAHKTYDVKKAFGAIARIHSTHTELTDRQRRRLDAFMRRYIERTRRSKDYTRQHRPHLADPRVVNGFRPLLKEIIYQLVVARSQGSKLWDLDGNEYVDALNGFGMNLFGWQPRFVVEAVRGQLDNGYEIGPQHPLAGSVAKLICELTGFDRAALCNTGSEAVMGTIRVARTITGRDTLVIFAGSYHGIFDEVIVRGTKKLRAVPAAPGILRNAADNVLVLDYGTPEALATIKERAHEIAAVLVEPVQSRRPDLQPREFLEELRAITRDAGTTLIFDEVVTGFRAHPRGAQEVLGIDADLAAYGKVVGGGFPIGVIAGKREFMDALDGGHWDFGDTSAPTVGVTYFAGTFVRHPLALAAAHAVLEHLKASGPALQERLNSRTGQLADTLNEFCNSVGAPITVTHFSSVWKINFSEDHVLQDLLFAMMRSRGIHLLDNFPCFFTTAHSEADFVAIEKAFTESVLELQESEFLPRRRSGATMSFDAGKPPLPGARLGKDAEGKPAWFVENPDAPGKFLKVNP